jgi:ribosomal protein L11 methyltransferase
MSWTEVVIEVPLTLAEALSEALLEGGALSVSVEDADFGTDAEQPLFGEPGMEPTEAAWERSRVVALTEAHQDHQAMVEAVCQECGIASGSLKWTSRSVEDQDWVRLTQSQFEPIHIGKNIWVVPSWHQAPDPTALILELDPGLAFGTGSHPTTRLCMEWLETHMAKGVSVLDYGCGSGILAIVAKKLGASEVIGVDIDPQAIVSARENTARNNCDVAFHVPESFGKAAVGRRYDVVVANILSSPLKLLAPMLAGRVAPGGALVLSGVLSRQAEEVSAAYAPFILLTVADECDGWVVLAGHLRGSATGEPG